MSKFIYNIPLIKEENKILLNAKINLPTFFVINSIRIIIQILI